VPLTLHVHDKERFAPLSGVSLPCRMHHDSISFEEDLLFTHRGLSGPAVLQISSYWTPGESLTIELLPRVDLLAELKAAKQTHPKRSLLHTLAEFFPKRLLEAVIDDTQLSQTMANFSDATLQSLAEVFQAWALLPNGTEGYRTAEVTLGGVDCNAISSKTMEALAVPGLYFIGEVLDVTGWLGGYNFQWAWSSGWAAGQAV